MASTPRSHRHPERSVAQTLGAAELFLAAASPEFGLEGLLAALLTRALEITHSDLGGAIFFVHPDTDELLHQVRFVGGHLENDKRALALDWRDRRDRLTSESEAGFHVFGRGKSLARVCLLAGERHAAMIQVESADRASYTNAERVALRELATIADVLLYRTLLRQHAARQGLDVHIVGASPTFLELERKLKLVAHAPSPVLITGERGSGKELAAYALHYFSGRRQRPFVPLNSAALSETLFSDELFGHERGAYTGANHQRQGALLSARGGTLFLDEIGDMTPRVQAALLRFLESGELRQIGSDLSVRVDVRVVAATNRNLHAMVREGSFRADIVDRLGVVDLQMPPLRDRQEDLPLLMNLMMKRACAETGRRVRIHETAMCDKCVPGTTPPCVSPGLIQACGAHDFLGNVRELRNVIVRLALLVQDDELQPAHLRDYLPSTRGQGDGDEQDVSLDAAIRAHIARVLEGAGNNKSAAARALGIPLTTLINKMKRLGMLGAS